jgi:uncharacterized hydrophobic protein (TIGR00271 family)
MPYACLIPGQNDRFAVGALADRLLFLRVYAPADRVAELVAVIAGLPDVRHVVRIGAAAGGAELVTADVEAHAADRVLELLERSGIAPADISLTRETATRPIDARPGGWMGSRDAVVWAEIVESARSNARVFMQYLAYMAAAGVIAAFGVINKSSILIVGAMAVSPDLLPMTAVCVGLIGGLTRLAGRAFVVLLVGLTLTGLVAGAVAVAMKAIGYGPIEVALGDGGLGTLPTINASTFLIAFAAGVAGMLAVETRASAAVGVGISITTIPAVSYAGVGFALGVTRPSLTALAVLGINVVMVLAAGTLTLAIQRRFGGDLRAIS